MLADFKNEVAQIKTLLTASSNILILNKENPSIDGLSSALALYMTLKNAGKSVFIACPSELTVEVSDLIGIDEVKKSIGGKNFVISWDYQDGAIEKVSYNIENKRFNLVIQPRQGHELDISPDKIDFKTPGISSDLIFAINTQSLDLLNQFYTQEQDLFSKTDIIVVDNDITNQNFGKINLITNGNTSLAEITAQIIGELGLKLESDAATNLLTGIDFTSGNLSGEDIRPETLEMAAWCLKHGGVRLNRKKVTNEEQKSVLEDVLKPDKSDGSKKTEKSSDEAPSPDWLQPKIYRGSTLV